MSGCKALLLAVLIRANDIETEAPRQRLKHYAPILYVASRNGPVATGEDLQRIPSK